MVLRQQCACHRRGMSVNMYGTAAKCLLATSRAARVCPHRGPHPHKLTGKLLRANTPHPYSRYKQGRPRQEKWRRLSLRPPHTHSLATTRADSRRPMTSRMNLPNRDPRNLASHTQSPTLAAPTTPNNRSLSCVTPLQSQTRCSLEKSSPQSGQSAHSSGSQGMLKVPR